MGEAQLIKATNQLVIRAVIIIYGDAANEEIAKFIAADIAHYWNEPGARVQVKKEWYDVNFEMSGVYEPYLMPETVYENTDPRNNYFRVEEYAAGDISFVDGLNSNTGYFKLANLLHNSTTAAHEFGHTIGLDHPNELDIRGNGTPGIMYPRGTLVDPEFQYYPEVPAGTNGGTLNPYKRKVLPADIADLKLHKLDFDKNGFAVVGGFSSIWHEKQVP
ncbi:peptidase M10 [Ferruginibacter sp.]